MGAFDPAEALRLIEAERITLIYGFDSHFKDLLEHPSRPIRDLSSLRHIACGGGAVDDALSSAYEQAIGIPLINALSLIHISEPTRP